MTTETTNIKTRQPQEDRKMESMPCIYGDAISACLKHAFGDVARAPDNESFDDLLAQLNKRKL